MPLLKREIELFPEDLFSLPLRDLPWAVAHVRSRHEKVLARFLHDRKVPFYCPTREVRRRRGGRTLTSWLPLFPGYVFFRATAEKWPEVWRSNVAASLVDVPDQQELHRELQQLRSLQVSGASLTPIEAFGFGDQVRVTSGSFEGYSGTVLRERGSERLIVSITLLRQTVSVEFHREVIRRTAATR